MAEPNAVTWFLVGIAILGVVIAVPLISAHGDGITVDEPHENGTEQDRHDDQRIRMHAYGPSHPDGNTTAWMAAHMGMTEIEWRSTHINTTEWRTTHANATVWNSGHAGVNESGWPGDGNSVGIHPHASIDGDPTDRHDERGGHGGMYGGGHGC
ncbi:hypothetical protein Huta_1135 [Halorhabdus utahensis DSM 12940]|uniref:Uncharacterized protein n=1 Tax=Halorhabdus utahensis (strain DSM 12940 / JCM 11049 / AX-2) TaxID=519442 RepID=C7NMA3_HALUD|nr:hypothetical protein [Halorhabdus utahensis]ACV11311.1 hypothetical protein Huta_1135 [Halorhabdus utahensis DSM 12940]